jgi:hypothetical protein
MIVDFCVVAPCSSVKSLTFRGNIYLHLQDRSARQARHQPKQLKVEKSLLPNISGAFLG